MTEASIYIILNALFIVGMHNTFQYDYTINLSKSEGKEVHGKTIVSKNIFWFWKYHVIERVPEWIGKPLGGCIRCMPSVFGIPFYLAMTYCYLPSNALGVAMVYPLYVITLSGLITIYDNFNPTHDD